MLAIFKRELRSYFTGVIGYVFLFIYLVVAAVVFAYSNLFGMSSQSGGFFTVMLIFSAIVLPLLTMKSFSEEKKTRTEQLLLTAPVSIPGMVIGKLLASYVVFAAAAIFTSFYFLLLIPYTQLQVATLIGSVFAHLMVGFVFISVGLFVSALTENQLSAAIGTIAIILVMLAVGLIGELLPSSYWLRFVLDAISVFTHFQTFVAGYFDFASVIYYLSVGGVFVWLTIRIFDRRRYA